MVCRVGIDIRPLTADGGLGWSAVGTSHAVQGTGDTVGAEVPAGRYDLALEDVFTGQHAAPET
jgi:hypothetical protein